MMRKTYQIFFQFQDARYIDRCLRGKKEKDAINKLKDNIETLKWLDDLNLDTSLIDRAALNGCNKFLVTLFNEKTVCISSQLGESIYFCGINHL